MSDLMSTEGFIKALLSPQRRDQIDPYQILTWAPIDTHHKVADIGCGPGYFALPLAKYLSYGRLYALDIDDEMLEAFRKRAEEARVSNIETMKCGDVDFPLEERSLDGLLLAFVIHESQNRGTFMSAAARLLKPKGWCCVLEWRRKETDDGPPLEIRIEPQEMEALARDAGLTPYRRRDLKGTQYMLLMRR